MTDAHLQRVVGSLESTPTGMGLLNSVFVLTSKTDGTARTDTDGVPVMAANIYYDADDDLVLQVWNQRLGEWQDVTLIGQTAYGEINNSGAAVATTVTTAGTFYVTAGTSALLAQARQFDSPSAGRLRYTGTKTREMLVSCYADFTANTNNLTITYQIRKNGQANTDAQVQSNKGNAADVRAVSITALIEMAHNDYLELWLTADANGVTVTKQNFNLNAVAIG